MIRGDEGCDRATLAERASLLGVIARLSEAVAVLSKAEGTEALTEDDRVAVGRLALALVPDDLDRRRRAIRERLSS